MYPLQVVDQAYFFGVAVDDDGGDRRSSELAVRPIAAFAANEQETAFVAGNQNRVFQPVLFDVGRQRIQFLLVEALARLMGVGVYVVQIDLDDFWQVG